MDSTGVQSSSAQLEQWIRQAQAGSADAFGRLAITVAPYLLWLANRELDPDVRAKGGASDLVQETFMHAQRGIGQFQGTTEDELLGWLRRILLNSMANFTRQFRVQKRRVAREASLDGTNSNGRARDQVALDAPSPSSFFMHQEQAEQLTLAIARLPEDYARVIRMRYWEQQSFEQIGETLKRSPDAARKLWARAIQRLQQELGDA